MFSCSFSGTVVWQTNWSIKIFCHQCDLGKFWSDICEWTLICISSIGAICIAMKKVMCWPLRVSHSSTFATISPRLVNRIRKYKTWTMSNWCRNLPLRGKYYEYYIRIFGYDSPKLLLEIYLCAPFILREIHVRIRHTYKKTKQRGYNHVLISVYNKFNSVCIWFSRTIGHFSA